MSVSKGNFSLSTSGDTDIIDITSNIAEIVRKFNVSDGLVHIFIAGSTAALTTIEYEPGAVEDLRQVIEELIPRQRTYKHNLAWGDGNGHSHVRAALMGPSLSIPVAEHNLILGTWQQVVLVDFDNRPRSRKVHVQVIGE